MLLGLKKQQILKMPERKYVLNPHQYIESILLVDALTSGFYTKHPADFVYVNRDNNTYTDSFLSKLYPDACFSHDPLGLADSSKNPGALQTDIPSNSVHYMYIGENISFYNESERTEIYRFIQDKLVPGGYVVIPYEATVGWSEYRVVLDLLTEINTNVKEDITSAAWLDKIFYELEDLAVKKIYTFKGKEFLNKLLYYLKSLNQEHLNNILCKKDFHTFYPYQIHQYLKQDSQYSFRFVGALPLIRNYVKLGLDAQQKAFLGETTDLMMASQRQDLISMPFHRVDIWQKNVDEVSEKGTISDFYFGCVSTFDQFPLKITKSHFTLNFMDAVYVHLRKLFNKRFMTIQEIVENTQHLVRAPQEIVDRVMLLVMGDQVRYTLTNPLTSVNAIAYQPSQKIKFKHLENQEMFSDPKRFYTEMGIVMYHKAGMLIPFDQKTSMVIAAFTKVHESLVPQYCAEIWAGYIIENIDMVAVEKEFRSILLFFKRHYLGKFLELGLLDQVLVE